MTGQGGWTRRGVIAAGVIGAAGRLRADETPRVVALDWGWASTLLCLGVPPAGVAEKRLYAAWVGEPALPPATVEVGLRTTPSLETLAGIRPSLILSNGLDALMRPPLERIAPVLDSPVFRANRTPLANARAAVRLLGDRIGRSAAAETWLADSDRRFATARARVAAEAGRPFIPVQFVDPHHIIYFGDGSLYADALTALGLRSAYPGRTSIWGSHDAEIASVAALPPADLFVIAPLPTESAALLDGPSLLASLIQAGNRRVYRLPPAWTFGDLFAATRFAELVAEALVPSQPGTLPGLPSRGST